MRSKIDDQDFYRWERAFQKSKDKVSFAEVMTETNHLEVKESGLKIYLGHCRIEVSRAFDPKTLKLVVQTLGAEK